MSKERPQETKDALEEALSDPSSSGDLLIGCLKHMCENQPQLWAHLTQSRHQQDQNQTQNMTWASVLSNIPNPSLSVSALPGGLSNIQWAINRHSVLRVSAKPACSDPMSPRRDPGVEGPKGDMFIERTVLGLLQGFSCKVKGHGRALLPQSSVCDGIEAEFTILQLIQGVQMPEEQFRNSLAQLTEFVARHHILLDKSLRRIPLSHQRQQEQQQQEEKEDEKEEEWQAPATPLPTGADPSTVKRILSGTFHNTVVKEWCSLQDSPYLAEMYFEWDRLATAFGMTDPAVMRLCHHDVHGRNVLIWDMKEEQGAGPACDGAQQLKAYMSNTANWVLIDWEYAGLSHPANDVANLICESFMDYDENIFEMPNIGGDVSTCPLAHRIQVCVDAYNTICAHEEQDLEQPKEPGDDTALHQQTSSTPTKQWMTAEHVWVGLCASHVTWSAWARCLLAQRKALNINDDPFPYERFASIREQLFRDSVKVLDKCLAQRRGDARSSP